MKPVIKRKTTTLLVIPLVLACFALLPRAQAETVTPLAFNGTNTWDGFNALANITTGTFNSAFGAWALENDTSGSHNTALGGQALRHNNGDFNTAVGENALVFNTTGSQNMAFGQGALANNLTGSNNTAMGFQALNVNTVSNNVAVGYQALRNNTTGFQNTANGTAALRSNTDGLDNTATGYVALVSNTTGSGNTATGSTALQDNTTGDANTAIGVNALQSNTTGDFNTAIGVNALLGNNGGNQNTAIGLNALLGNTGSSNIALGVSAGRNLTTGNFNIDVGNSGVAGESNTTRIGSVQSRTFIAGIRGRITGVANAVPVLIDSAGQLGTASSSRRFKKEMKPMDQTSEAILSLKPVTFHYKSDSTGTPQFGLIAEEVAAVNPDLVVPDENGEIYTVRYDAINAMLLNEFLKEHRKNEQQEATIAELRQEIKTLTAGLQKVSAQLQLNKPAPQTVLNNQ
jgi:trimeric autotransporter adhesin